jgi:hypothetical protein
LIPIFVGKPELTAPASASTEFSDTQDSEGFYCRSRRLPTRFRKS